MENVICSLIDAMKYDIKKDMYTQSHLIEDVLNAYNDYQDDERDGVDYIFSIANKDDLVCCVQGGLTAKEIAFIYDESSRNALPYFMFGQNHRVPFMIPSMGHLVNTIVGCLDEIVKSVIANPSSHESYKKLYDIYLGSRVGIV